MKTPADDTAEAPETDSSVAAPAAGLQADHAPPQPPPAISRDQMRLVWSKIYESKAVQRAYIVQRDSVIRLHMVVNDGTWKSSSKNLGENLVRLAKTYLGDVVPQKALGTGIFDYELTVTTASNNWFLRGQKPKSRDDIDWSRAKGDAVLDIDSMGDDYGADVRATVAETDSVLGSATFKGIVRQQLMNEPGIENASVWQEGTLVRVHLTVDSKLSDETAQKLGYYGVWLVKPMLDEPPPGHRGTGILGTGNYTFVVTIARAGRFHVLRGSKGPGEKNLTWKTVAP
jgi:hypothetical protein